MTEWPKNEEGEIVRPEEREQRLQQLKERVLTSVQYREQPFARNEEQRTYILELSTGQKRLVYFGSPHISDPTDPLFNEIEERFKTLGPQIVYVEGMRFINQRPENEVREHVQSVSKEEAKEKGENYYTLKLAVDAGTLFESPEPTWSEEVKYLEEAGFSKKDIFNFYFYRSIYGYQRRSKKWNKKECLEYVDSFLEVIRNESDWEIEKIDRLKAEAIDELDITNETKYRDQIDPIPWEGKPQTVINDVSRASTHFRDEHILERIVEGLERYDRIFVVYGSGHAVKHEPALRELFSVSTED